MLVLRATSEACPKHGTSVSMCGAWVTMTSGYDSSEVGGG